jgi:hypothetical protein
MDEWQSAQDRSRIATTSGGTFVLAWIVLPASTAGLVRSGRMSWTTAKTAINAIAAHFAFRISRPRQSIAVT